MVRTQQRVYNVILRLQIFLVWMMIALLRQDLAIAMEAERVTDVVYVVIDDVRRAWCLLWYRDTRQRWPHQNWTPTGTRSPLTLNTSSFTSYSHFIWTNNNRRSQQVLTDLTQSRPWMTLYARRITCSFSWSLFYCTDKVEKKNGMGVPFDHVEHASIHSIF